MTTTFDFPQAEILRRQQEKIAKQISEFNYWGDEVTQAIAAIMRIKEGVKTLGTDALQQVVVAFRAALDEAVPHMDTAAQVEEEQSVNDSYPILEAIERQEVVKTVVIPVPTAAKAVKKPRTAKASPADVARESILPSAEQVDFKIGDLVKIPSEEVATITELAFDSKNGGKLVTLRLEDGQIVEFHNSQLEYVGQSISLGDLVTTFTGEVGTVAKVTEEQVVVVALPDEKIALIDAKNVEELKNNVSFSVGNIVETLDTKRIGTITHLNKYPGKLIATVRFVGDVLEQIDVKNLKLIAKPTQTNVDVQSEPEGPAAVEPIDKELVKTLGQKILNKSVPEIAMLLRKHPHEIKGASLQYAIGEVHGASAQGLRDWKDGLAREFKNFILSTQESISDYKWLPERLYINVEKLLESEF